MTHEHKYIRKNWVKKIYIKNKTIRIARYICECKDIMTRFFYKQGERIPTEWVWPIFNGDDGGEKYAQS